MVTVATLGIIPSLTRHGCTRGEVVKRDYSGVWILVATILGSSMAVIDGAFVEAFQNVMWIAAAMAFLSALVARVAIEGRPKHPSAG
jgi:hypothetical protein